MDENGLIMGTWEKTKLKKRAEAEERGDEKNVFFFTNHISDEFQSWKSHKISTTNLRWSSSDAIWWMDGVTGKTAL